jgi:hypothetical protein
MPALILFLISIHSLLSYHQSHIANHFFPMNHAQKTTRCAPFGTYRAKPGSSIQDISPDLMAEVFLIYPCDHHLPKNEQILSAVTAFLLHTVKVVTSPCKLNPEVAYRFSLDAIHPESRTVAAAKFEAREYRLALELLTGAWTILI